MKTKHPYSPLTLLLAGLVIVIVLGLSAATPARAELHRFILEYENTSNTRAQARGFIVIDDDPAEFENPGSSKFPSSNAFVKDVQITVSKATDKTHNGTFTASDFSSIVLLIGIGGGGGTADLSKDLVGQAAVNNFEICSTTATNPLAPNCPSGVFNMQTGGADDGNPASGDTFTLVSCRPMSTTSARVYKCTMSLKGSYKYCDRDYTALGEPRWVCKKYRQRVNYYMTIDPVNGKVSFFWLDPKARTFEFAVGYALPALKYVQCRPPTARAPAGKWEACLSLWCHIEDIDIDFRGPPIAYDATRCRIGCLTGGESLRTFTYRTSSPDINVRLKDHAVARLRGGFCQTTRYSRVHYSFGDPKRDKVLRWPFAPDPGAIIPGGGFSCITGTMSCRLDTRLTGEAIRVELDGILADPAENALISVLEGKGWTLDRGSNKNGAPLTLQPDPGEHLQPLIP